MNEDWPRTEDTHPPLGVEVIMWSEQEQEMFFATMIQTFRNIEHRIWKVEQYLSDKVHYFELTDGIFWTYKPNPPQED